MRISKEDKQWLNKRIKTYKAYKPLFKTQKKVLKNYTKEFDTFDYGYMDNITFQCVKMYYDFFKNTDLLYQDTKHVINEYDKLIGSLKKCVDLIIELEHTYDGAKEFELRKQIYQIIAEDGWRWSD